MNTENTKCLLQSFFESYNNYQEKFTFNEEQINVNDVKYILLPISLKKELDEYNDNKMIHFTSKVKEYMIVDQKFLKDLSNSF